MRMPGSTGRAWLAGVLLTASLLAYASPVSGSAVGTTAPAPAQPAPQLEASLSAWTGGIDLYRPGIFSRQLTWYWCTAATVQMARNIVLHQADHSYGSQQAYFDWMRQRDRYALPLSAGVDAAGWSAGFRQFVDARYALFASSSFDAALRSAVINLRLANLPVALAVDHGNHAWLLTGFTATADPARTSRFTVTSVRVTGPLYGLQSKNGYDMPPDTRLTPSQLRGFFTPWWYAPIRMVWDGRFVSIQPVPGVTSRSTPPAPSPTRAATSTPTPSATASLPTSSPTAAPSSPSMAAGAGAASSSPPIAAASLPTESGRPADGATALSPAPSAGLAASEAASDTSVPVVQGAGLAVLLGLLSAALVAAGRRRTR